MLVTQLILLRKSDCLECAVLLCLVVCLTLLTVYMSRKICIHVHEICHLSLEHVYSISCTCIQTFMYMYTDFHVHVSMFVCTV